MVNINELLVLGVTKVVADPVKREPVYFAHQVPAHGIVIFAQNAERPERIELLIERELLPVKLWDKSLDQLPRLRAHLIDISQSFEPLYCRIDRDFCLLLRDVQAVLYYFFFNVGHFKFAGS